jgi:SpoVK/Ycf46/Vps4 family AAA+-type ATPase
MLNAREPKIVNGPQILDKYVGESEANIRKLFAEADEEEKRVRISILFIKITKFFFSLDLIVVYI